MFISRYMAGPIIGWNKGPSFNVPLNTNLVTLRAFGSSTPTFARASTAYAIGYAAGANAVDGQTAILCASGEARFSGARRVSEGVWANTFADGSAIPDATLKGYVVEGARADVLGATAEIRRTMADAGWVAGATMTKSLAVGLDGVTDSGACMTGGAVEATNTVLYTTVLASAARTFSAWVRRKTGTGTVRMTDNGGTNWTDITLTTSYQLFQLTRTQANPVVGFQIATLGDAIEVDFNTIEAATFANPTPIPVNVSKAGDNDNYPLSGNISGTTGTVYCEFVMPSDNQGIIVGSSTGGYPMRSVASTLGFYDGTTNRNGTALAASANVRKAAISWGGTTGSSGLDGTVTSGITFDGDMSLSGVLQIGGIASAQFFGTIRNVRIWNRKLSDAQLQALTS